MTPRIKAPLDADTLTLLHDGARDTWPSVFMPSDCRNILEAFGEEVPVERTLVGGREVGR